MKELQGAAATSVAASIEETFAFLLAIDGYPSWFPAVVRRADVLERDPDGRPTRATATLHASVGPIVRDFDLRLTVTTEHLRTITLARIPHDPSDPERFDVVWRLAPAAGAAGSEIRLALSASLSVPRLVPVGGIGESMATGFVAAAADALGHGPA